MRKAGGPPRLGMEVPAEMHALPAVSGEANISCKRECSEGKAKLTSYLIDTRCRYTVYNVIQRGNT